MTDPNSPWESCPWCGRRGATYATQRQCKYYSKADCDCLCANCGHEHEGLTSSGKCVGIGYERGCGCAEFKRFPTPCEKELGA